TGENKTAAEAIQNALTPETVTGDGVSAAANSVANQNTVTANDEVLAKLNAAIGQGGTQATDQNTTIVVQPYMDIAIEDVDTQAQTVTLEITPMYRTVATTADVEHNGDIVLEADPTGDPVNAVQIGEEKPLTITKPVTMTLTLPDGFKDKTVYIQHKGYEYSAAAGSDGKITFTNPHGFSSFTFDTTSHAVAKIEGTSYTSLQDAVNHVQDGQTITLLKDGQSATVDREVSFIIGNEGGNAYKAVLAPGSGYTMTEGENGQYTFAKKVTPGPGGEEEDGFPFTDVKTSDWYYDAVKYVYENGLMAGTSETTFAPEVKLNRAMAVQILYNLEGKPAVTEAATFTDAAAAGEWALDAIAWAQQTGVVAGMGDNLFAPAAQVTREQFAQMMYNYAKYKGYDLTAAGDLAQFTDSGKLQSWAVTAMKWANGNGLINGFEDNTLQPAGTTIRGQAASIIMNFDKNVAK
ncbi:MAG: S-layer homology domain-containing protein, partial [Acutalibacter sp.]